MKDLPTNYKTWKLKSLLVGEVMGKGRVMTIQDKATILVVLRSTTKNSSEILAKLLKGEGSEVLALAWLGVVLSLLSIELYMKIP